VNLEHLPAAAADLPAYADVNLKQKRYAKFINY